MVLPTLSGTITAADLKQGFDDEIGNITAQAQAGRRKRIIWHEALALTAGTDVVLDFTPQDDLELRMIGVHANNDVSLLSGPVVTFSLEEAGGTTSYLIEQTWRAQLTTNGAATPTPVRVNYENDLTLPKLFLSAGITYRARLSLDTGGPLDRALGVLGLMTRRRRR